MTFRYLPSEFAVNIFGLTEKEYKPMKNEGLTDFFVNLLGKSNYDRYMIAQDSGDKESFEVDVITNEQEAFSGDGSLVEKLARCQYASIGQIVDFKPR